MAEFAQIIVAAAKVSRGYAERLLAGVTAQQFARKPVFGPTTVSCNHPAWVYGHLATYPAKMAAMVGMDPAGMAAPVGFEELFKDGTECKDDPQGVIYPGMGVVTAAFFKAHDALYETLGGVDDAKLLAETPDEKARARFPRVGARLLFMCNNHVMMHMGQISTWRRCMGLAAA